MAKKAHAGSPGNRESTLNSTQAVKQINGSWWRRSGWKPMVLRQVEIIFNASSNIYNLRFNLESTEKDSVVEYPVQVNYMV
jgi:hypothetical protein